MENFVFCAVVVTVTMFKTIRNHLLWNTTSFRLVDQLNSEPKDGIMIGKTLIPAVPKTIARGIRFNDIRRFFLKHAEQQTNT